MTAPLRAAVNARGMVALLEQRKATLEEQIRQRFAEARERGEGKPDVRALSAVLRAVRVQLERAQAGSGGA